MLKLVRVLLAAAFLSLAAPVLASIEPLRPALAQTKGTAVYVVQPGDTLTQIASAYHTTVSSLAALNEISNPNLIYSGEHLQVPASLNGLPQTTRTLVCTLTAYTDGYQSTGKYPGEPGYGITSTGQVARQGLSIAVDPNVIPYGTPVYIPGVGLRIADDTGGAIVGNRIDVFYNRQQTALNFGVKRSIVYLLPRSSVRIVHDLPVLSPRARTRQGVRRFSPPTAENAGLPLKPAGAPSKTYHSQPARVKSSGRRTLFVPTSLTRRPGGAAGLPPGLFQSPAGLTQPPVRISSAGTAVSTAATHFSPVRRTNASSTAPGTVNALNVWAIDVTRNVWMPAFQWLKKSL